MNWESTNEVWQIFTRAFLVAGEVQLRAVGRRGLGVEDELRTALLAAPGTAQQLVGYAVRGAAVRIGALHFDGHGDRLVLGRSIDVDRPDQRDPFCHGPIV